MPTPSEEPLPPTLNQLADYWTRNKHPRNVPKDLDWDRHIAGKTRPVSNYSGDMLEEMFRALANKFLKCKSTSKIIPGAHAINTTHKIVRMAYQICHENKVSRLAVGAATWTFMADVSRVLENQNVNLTQYFK